MTGREHPSVLHLLWSGRIGGAERAVYQLAREQRKRGIDVGVAFGQADGPYVSSFEEAGVEVIGLDLARGGDVGKVARSAGSIERYDIHHFHTVEPLTFSASVRSGSRARVFTQRAGVQHREAMKKRLRRAIAGRQLRRHFVGWCGNTSYAARTLTEVFAIPPNAIDVVYNGIDFSLLEPRRSRSELRSSLGIGDDEFVFGVTAYLKAWKRIERLLEAAATPGLSEARILIVGDGPRREYLESRARDLGVSERTIFTGMQTHVFDHVAAMDAFVLSSGAVETFGNSVIEAMGLGVPSVVFSDSPGVNEHVENSATGFVVATTDELADLLTRLRSDAALRARVGDAGRTHVRSTYSIEQTASGYSEVYERGLHRLQKGTGLKTVAS